MVNEFESSRYATLARQEWSEHLPRVVAQMDNPRAFFASLGEQVSVRLGQMYEQMSQQVPSSLPYLERVGQLKAIRKQAEELVLQEMIFDPISQSQVEDRSPREQLEEALGQAPHPRDLEMDLIAIRHEAEDEAEDEGWDEVSYSREQQERLDWMLQVRPLINLEPSLMSEESMLEAATALQTLLSQRP